MIITSIEPQKKNKTRYSLYIDGEFACGVQDEVALRFKLAKDKEITEKELEQIKAEDEFMLARQATARYLQLRLHSTNEIKYYLRRKEFSEDNINRTIEYFKTKGDINDVLFAEKYIQSKRKLKPVGKLKLKKELIEKGVDKNIIDEILRNIIADEDELQAAQLLLQKKLKSLKDKPKEKLFQSLYNYLLYNGIPSHLAIAVIKKEIKEDFSEQ